MYRVLAIEDNFFSRNALLKTVRWSACRCELVGQAINGVEGEEKALALMPQIIITDIRMPGCNGIEMIARLRKAINPLKVIVVTGFKSFDYAHAFVQLGATDFLLKPLEPNLLEKALIKAVGELDSEKALHETIYNAHSRIEQLNEDLYMSKEVLRNRVLSDILTDSSADETELRSRFAEVMGDIPIYGILLTRNSVRDTTALSGAIEERYPQMRCILLPVATAGSLMVCGGDKSAFLSQWSELGDRWHNASAEFEDIAIMSPAVTRLQYIAPMYDALTRASKRRLSSIVIPDERAWDTQATAIRLIQASPDTMTALLEQIVDEMFFARKSISGICNEALNVLDAYEQLSQGKVFIPQSIVSAGSALSILQKVQCGEDICSFLKDKLLTSVDEDDFGKYSAMVRSVYAYMCIHYAENIALSSLSDVFFLTSNYLGSLIKRETGRSFSDILTSIRINQAKKLLCDPRLHIHQVCAMVGYSEYPYFYQVFKKHTGMSPKAFRRNPEGAIQ